jgi:hypothetical protein
MPENLKKVNKGEKNITMDVSVCIQACLDTN